MSKVFLIEDHDEALSVWRKLGLRSFDLVHIDAHIDFGAFAAKPLEKAFQEARNIKEMKRRLEQSILFKRYEKDFNIQTNIGNYVYPAIEEGIVKDFYWVIPGGLKEFKESAKIIKNIIEAFKKQGLVNAGARFRDGACSLELLGRKFVICILEKLPALEERVLLDIDTDFLVIESLIVADNTQKISQRKPWISPSELANSLKNKKIKPQVVTIAYSVNGGFTPMVYKHLGDEIAYNLSPAIFKKHFYKSSEAGRYFNLFSSTAKSKYYKKAVKIDSSYRAGDNNYGLLYLQVHKLKLAEKEFLKIIKVDPRNPAAVLGLGNIALAKKHFLKARGYFQESLKNARQDKLFSKTGKQGLLKLAEAEFHLQNIKRSKRLLIQYQALQPTQFYSRYLLGRIYEKEKDFLKAAGYYKDAVMLGGASIEIICRLLKLPLCLKEDYGIINTIDYNYEQIKKKYLSVKDSRLKNKRAGKLKKLEKKIAVLKEKIKGGKQNARGQSIA